MNRPAKQRGRNMALTGKYNQGRVKRCVPAIYGYYQRARIYKLVNSFYRFSELWHGHVTVTKLYFKRPPIKPQINCKICCCCFVQIHCRLRFSFPSSALYDYGDPSSLHSHLPRVNFLIAPFLFSVVPVPSILRTVPDQCC